MIRNLVDAEQALRLRIAFDAAIDQLTQPAAVDGRGLVPCLLDQLTDALVPGSEHTGKTTTASRPPVSMDALALATDIGVEMRQALAVLAEPVPARLSAQVRTWAAHAEQWQHDFPDYLTYATDRAEHWVGSIRALLEPPRRYPLRGFACPDCWHTTVEVWSEVEEAPVRRPALAIDAHCAEATCAVCAARWDLDQWEQLAATLRQQQHDTLALAETDLSGNHVDNDDHGSPY